MKVDKTYEFQPVTPAYLLLVSLLRRLFGESSRVPAQLAEKALPQLKMRLGSKMETDDRITIQADVNQTVTVHFASLARLRQQLEEMNAL